MANRLTRSLREEMIETRNLDIPYNAERFLEWLTGTQGKSRRDASRLATLIRKVDIEIWEPGDPEIFQLISGWIHDARSTKYDCVGGLLYDYVFMMIKSQIEYFQDLKCEITSKSQQFIDEVLDAYQYYLTFMRVSLGYSEEELERMYYVEEDADVSEEDWRGGLTAMRHYTDYLLATD